MREERGTVLAPGHVGGNVEAIRNRNAQRSVRLLEEALTLLIAEKPYDKITVSDITRRADLNRGTFYFHYTDTYDLRNQIEDELVEELKEAIAEFQPEQAEFSLRPMLKKVFDYVLSQKFLFRTFFRSSSNSGLQNKVMAVVEENIDNARSELESNESERSRKYHSRFMSSGVMGCVNLWLENSNEMAVDIIVDELDEMFQRILKGA